MNRYFVLCFAFYFTLCSLVTFAQDVDQNYEKALSAYQANKYSEVYIHLKNALQKDADNLPARLLLAQIHFNEGDIFSAEEESDQALLLGADINLVLPVYGPSLLLQGKIDKLLEIEKVYASLTPASRFEWALLKGQAYLAKKEPELARAEFERAESMFPAEVRANNTLASIYAIEGMFSEAGALIDRSLILEPRNAKTWQLRGQLAFYQQDYPLALSHFDTAHAIAPDDPMILRSLAQVNLLLGDHAEMQRYLGLILAQSPEDPAAILLEAVLLMDQGDQQLGQEMLANLSSKLSGITERSTETTDKFLFIRAASDYVRGSDESAITLFNTYLIRHKDDIAAIRMLVDIYLRNGESVRATQFLADNRAYIKHDFGLSLQLLQLYIQANNTFGATELLEDIKKDAPDHPYVIMLEAEFLRSSGRSQAALSLINGRKYDSDEPLSYALLRGALQLDLRMEQAAQQTAQLLLKQYPENLRVLNFSAVTWLRVDNLEQASSHISAALALDADNLQARFNQAMLLKKRGDLESSSKVLNSILEDHPSHTKSIMLKARSFYELGEFQNAIDWSKKVYAYQPSSNAPGELQLDVYAQQGDWPKALPVALKLTKQNPLNADYQVRLAKVYMGLKDNTSAQRPLYKLYNLWEDDAPRLQVLARLQRESENFAAARKSLQRAQKIDPKSLPVRLALARLFLLEGNANEAAEAAAKLQLEFDERTEFSQLLGEIALAHGKPETAQRHFKKAYELDEKNGDPVIQLYQLSLQGIGGAEFTALLEATLRKSSLSPWNVRILADSHLAQGNQTAAARLYENLLTLPESGNDPEILNNLANIYAVEDLDRALATAKKGLRAKGQNSAALLDTIGWILTRQKKFEAALPYLREAYALNSTDPQIRYHTGVTLLGLGRRAEAEKELRAALLTRFDFPGRAEALAIIGTTSE